MEGKHFILALGKPFDPPATISEFSGFGLLRAPGSLFVQSSSRFSLSVFRMAFLSGVSETSLLLSDFSAVCILMMSRLSKVKAPGKVPHWSGSSAEIRSQKLLVWERSHTLEQRDPAFTQRSLFFCLLAAWVFGATLPNCHNPSMWRAGVRVSKMPPGCMSGSS